MKKPESAFTRLDTAADGLLRRMAKGDTALLWLQARWGRIVGEPLSRKIEPASLQGRRLTVVLHDPAWKKAVVATLPDLEAKLAREMPELKPRVTLRETGGGRR
ncbi:MAG: DciA family protein [Thermoanaerobaculia bacterium]